jgi:hypothetical protein
MDDDAGAATAQPSRNCLCNCDATDRIIDGLQLNSALYLVSAFGAGIILERPAAWRLALAAMGITYLSYLVQYNWPGRLCAPVTWASIILGVAAWITLLF